MKKLFPHIGFIISAALTLTSCNLFGGIDKPSGDIQLLDAARACLDQGDFDCANDYYQKISDNTYDIKAHEGSLAILGKNNVFYMSDLISSLGGGIGSASSLITLAQTLRTREKTTSTTFDLIQSTYSRSSGISDPTLKAFSQLISSIAMMSAVLGNPVGPDGILTASDLAATPNTCKSQTPATCAAAASCDDTTNGYFADGNESVSMDTAGWSGSGTAKKFRVAAAAAETASTELGVSSGIFGAISEISATTGATSQQQARCTRMYLLQTFFQD